MGVFLAASTSSGRVLAATVGLTVMMLGVLGPRAKGTKSFKAS